MVEEPRFTGWDHWPHRRKELHFCIPAKTSIYLTSTGLYQGSTLSHRRDQYMEFKTSMAHPFRELKSRKDSKPHTQGTPKSLYSEEERQQK